MKYLRLCSDVHVDFDYHRARFAHQPPVEHCWLPLVMPGDDDTVMVIAGDISSNRLIIDVKYPDGECWLQKVCKRFKYVVAVLGNHDYYGRNFLNEHEVIKRQMGELKVNNFHLLEKDTVTLDDVKFVGATLWTNFNKHDPMVLHKWSSFMVIDKTNIRGKYEKTYRRYPSDEAREPDVTVEQIYERFMSSKKYIFSHLKPDVPDQKVIVVTHMAPSEKSISEKFRLGYTDIMYVNHYFYSDLEKQIGVSGPDLWFHGHMHLPFDYQLGRTRVVCNPRGYPFEPGTQFNDTWRIEL